MRLCLSQREREQAAGGVLSAGVALIATSVMILAATELIDFSVLYPVWTMLLTGIGVCVVFGVLTALRKRACFYLAMLLILLLLSVFFNSQILNGIYMLWNRVGDCWLAATGWVLPELSVSADAETAQVSLLLMSLQVGITLAVLFCALASYRVPVLSVLFSGAVLCVMMAFRESVDFPYLLPAILVAVVLLMHREQISGRSGLRAVFSRLLPAILAGSILLPIAQLPAVRIFSGEVSEDLRTKFHDWKYETKYTTLPEGDFSDFCDDGTETKPALVVTMEKAEPMYLRGFTGAVFEDECWTALDLSVVAENEDLLYWLNLNEFNLNAQFERAVFPEGLTGNRITVQNIGACSRYLYLPYNLCADSSLRAENLNTDGIQSNRQRTYIFSTIGSTEQINQVLEYLRTSEEESVRKYRKAESAYRDFVYENYLDIPQETLDLLRESWDRTASRYGAAAQLSAEQAQECIQTFLEECFSEDGEDTIKLPLNIAQGSSYQYATVAVLTLRYFGIPARYAEGYVITEKMASAVKSTGRIEVDSGSAAAWAEFYQDGIGWIPMSVMLGMEDVPMGSGEGQGDEGQDNAKAPLPSELEPEEGDELEERPQNMNEKPQPDGGYVIQLPGLLLRIAWIIVVILLLLVSGLLLRRKWLLKRKQMRFDAEDTNEAIAWIFADIVQLLERMGFHRGNGSMLALRDLIRQRFGEEYVKEFECSVELNARAMFSSQLMTSEQKMCVVSLRDATLQHMKSGKKWHEKLWIQWVLCLY